MKTLFVIFVVLGAIVCLVFFYHSKAGDVSESFASDRYEEPVVRPSVLKLPQRAVVSDDQDRTAVAAAHPEESGNELIVLDVEERPVAGARIDCVVTGAERSLGRTNSLGELQVAAEGFLSGELVITAPGFITERPRLKAPVDKRSTFHIRRGWELSGLVVDSDGLPLGAGMTVLAVGPLDYLGTGVLERTLRGNPIVPMTATDEHGQFVLTGLDPEQGYHIFVGGLGRVGFDRSKVFSFPTEALVIIKASPVYGALLVFRDEAGDPPRIADFDGAWHGTATLAFGQARSLFTTDVTPRLLGLPPGAVERESFYDKLFFFTVEEDIGETTPLQFRGKLPGYRDIAVTVDAKRAIHDIAHHQILITPEYAGLGSVDIIATPADLVEAVLSSAESSGASGGCELVLKRVDSNDELRVALPALLGGIARVDGIPHGDYRATFRASHKLFRFPATSPVMLRIGPEPALFEISLADLGAMEIRVLTSDGHDYGGPVVGSHMRLPNREMDAFHFTSAPYNVPLLPPGEYEVALDGMEWSDPAQSTRTVVIEPGRRTTVEFAVGR